jgi:hypothetical protein
MSQDNSIPDEWYFITAPESVNIKKGSKSTEVATYGTNNPYLNYGTTQLRTLTLSNSMLEGFSNAKEVEGNITQLESCMRMIIDEGTGFTAPYCWHVFAGSKSYGTYIIKDVSIREKMRDMTGKATRAFVDISLQEVSPYQVTSGTDITSTAAVGDVNERFAAQLEVANANNQVNSQDTSVSNANAANGGVQGAEGDPVAPKDPSIRNSEQIAEQTKPGDPNFIGPVVPVRRNPFGAPLPPGSPIPRSTAPPLTTAPWGGMGF